MKQNAKKLSASKIRLKLAAAKQHYSTAAALAAELKHRARAVKEEVREARKKYKKLRKMAQTAKNEQRGASEIIARLASALRKSEGKAATKKKT